MRLEAGRLPGEKAAENWIAENAEARQGTAALRLLAGMLAAGMGGSVRGEAEKKLRAGEAVTLEQGAQQEERHQRIGDHTHPQLRYNTGIQVLDEKVRWAMV